MLDRRPIFVYRDTTNEKARTEVQAFTCHRANAASIAKLWQRPAPEKPGPNRPDDEGKYMRAQLKLQATLTAPLRGGHVVEA